MAGAGRSTARMYSLVYHGFTEEFGLKPVSIVLLAIIASYSEGGLLCWHGLASFAELTGSTQPTVLKHLGILRKLGLIERGPPHPKYGTNQWKLGLVGESKFEEIQKNLRQAKENKGQAKENLTEI